MSADAALAGSGSSLRRRIVRLMAVRLAVAVGALVLALALVGAGREGAERAELGLYGTLAFAFLSTALCTAGLALSERLGRVAIFQLVSDVGTVTALVGFSGGVESIFSFLYLPIVLYGAMLFGRGGSYAVAACCSLSYAAILLVDPAGPSEGARGIAGEVLLAGWGVHTGALLLVALLSSALAREIRIASERLDARTTDLETLRRLHERTVDSLTSGLLTLDREGRIRSFNPEAERITGFRATEALGRGLDEVLPGASEVMAGCVEPGARLGRLRLRFRHANGREGHLGIAASILRDERGASTGHVVIFQDVTDVVRMERDLRRSERLAGVGQLAADIAHEIRNPLAAISGSLEMLRNGRGARAAAEEDRRLMEIALREIDRLNGLITDFLQYARPAPPKAESLELAGAVEEILQMARSTLPEDVQVEVSVPRGLCVQADGTQLRQILWNLISNAQEAMGRAGVLRISARVASPLSQEGEPEDRNAGEEGSPGVEIVVADTGAGISPPDLERIFDPFFTTKAQGTGLGLATVHRIVEAHNGHVRVDSRSGLGTEFQILLPLGEVSS